MKRELLQQHVLHEDINENLGNGHDILPPLKDIFRRPNIDLVKKWDVLQKEDVEHNQSDDVTINLHAHSDNDSDIGEKISQTTVTVEKQLKLFGNRRS